MWRSRRWRQRSRWIWSKSGWISTNLIKIWPDLNGSCQNLIGSRQISSRFGLIWPNLQLERGGVWSSQLDLDFHAKTHQLTRQIRFLKMKICHQPPLAVGQNGFWYGSDDLSRWIRSQVSMDSPKRCSAPKVYIGPL